MAKRTKDEIMSTVKEILGDRNDDKALAFLEDLSDTISGGENIDFKAKYEQALEDNKTLDETWRKKYTERFFSPTDDHTLLNKTNPANTDKDKDTSDDEDEKLEHANKVTFDDLFTEKEK